MINCILKLLLVVSCFNIAFAKEYFYYEKGIKTQLYLVSKNIKKIKPDDPDLVFSSHPNGQGITRSIPGGLIIKFKSNIKQEDIDKWFAMKGFVVERQFTPRWYKVKGPSGLLGLELANEISSDPLILHANPDWLLNVNTRKKIKNNP